jgi:hypothetical protein
MSKSQKLRRNSAQMYAIIASYEQSGLPQSVFCAEQDLPLHVFTYWLHHYRSAQGSNLVEPSVGFKEIRATPPDTITTSSFIRIRDSRGFELEFDSGISVTFLRALLSW